MGKVKTLVQEAQDLEEKYIERAWRNFSKAMKDPNRMSSDAYPSFSVFCKDVMGYIPAGNELYTQYSHDAAEWLDVSDRLAYLYRIGSRVEIAKLEDKYYSYN